MKAKIRQIGKTGFLPLPFTSRWPIPGGCRCRYCTAHPHSIPQWDTLAFDTTNPSHTWTVHFPELVNGAVS
jgi:hypothetical protein